MMRGNNSGLTRSLIVLEVQGRGSGKIDDGDCEGLEAKPHVSDNGQCCKR